MDFTVLAQRIWKRNRKDKQILGPFQRTEKENRET